jgi:hypothetical protein
MKRSFMIAMGIGFLKWGSLQLPGMSAANLFWEAVGNSPIMGTAIGWAVNAVVYGLVVLIIIRALKITSAAANKISN